MTHPDFLPPQAFSLLVYKHRKSRAALVAAARTPRETVDGKRVCKSSATNRLSISARTADWMVPEAI